MGESKDFQSVYSDLIKIRKAIENFKTAETNLEKIRLLKMIDAELMDALYNLESLLELSDQELK
jgi:hypothetical protein